MLEHSETTLGGRLVMFVLAEYAHDDGTQACPAVDTIARKARMTVRGVQKALRRLEDDRHIAAMGVSEYGTTSYSLLGITPDRNDVRGRTAFRKGEPRSEKSEPGSPEPLEVPKEPKEPIAAPPGRTVEKSVDNDRVREAWLTAPGMVQHRPSYFTEAATRRLIEKSVKRYGVEDVVGAIQSYAGVLASKNHFWSHRWTLADFLKRGLDRFVPEAEPLTTFLVEGAPRERTPAERQATAESWILKTAWMLPLEEYEVAEELGRRGVEGPERARLLDMWRSRRESV